MTLLLWSRQLQTHTSPDLRRVSFITLLKRILKLCTLKLNMERIGFVTRTHEASPLRNPFFVPPSIKSWRASLTPVKRWVQHERFSPQFPVCKQKQRRVWLGFFNIFPFPRSLRIFVFLLVAQYGKKCLFSFLFFYCVEPVFSGHPGLVKDYVSILNFVIMSRHQDAIQTSR